MTKGENCRAWKTRLE